MTRQQNMYTCALCRQGSLLLDALNLQDMKTKANTTVISFSKHVACQSFYKAKNKSASSYLG